MQFIQNQRTFLGHIVGRAGLECDPNKLSAVANWIPPNTIKGVREFLGFTGYHRRFVPDYSTVAQPLVCLLGKDCKFKWTDACQDAFEALRALLTHQSPSSRAGMAMQMVCHAVLNVREGHAHPNTDSSPSDPEQPYATSCIGSSLDSELIPLESGETCVAAVMIAQSENSKLITTAQKTDSEISIVRDWLITGIFHARTQDFAPASYELKAY